MSEIDVYALAQEVRILLEKERGKPEKKRRSFREITMGLYRDKCILGTEWSRFNREIGLILHPRGIRHLRKKNAPIAPGAPNPAPPTPVTRLLGSGSITLGERSPDIVTMTINDKWKFIACRGERDVIAQASEIESGKPIEQNKIPGDLLKEARGLANWYLRRDRETRSIWGTET